jgi:hypothetical protein
VFTLNEGLTVHGLPAPLSALMEGHIAPTNIRKISRVRRFMKHARNTGQIGQNKGGGNLFGDVTDT